MNEMTRKPSGERGCAPDGPTPAGRARRSRRAEQARKQAPARPCAPKSARPDQSPASKPPQNETAKKDHTGVSRSGPVPVPGVAGGKKPKLAKPQTLSQRGAMALAKQLEQYWHERGYPAARFWAEPIDERFEKVGTYEIYRVACNLVNGLPPRYRDQDVPPAPSGRR